MEEAVNVTSEKTLGEKAADLGKSTMELPKKAKESVVNVIDANGNGEIDIEDIIILGLRAPGIRINRAQFLQKELFKNFEQEIIDEAIATTPAKANISAEDIDKIADEVIKFERNCVSGISAALGAPGGVAMVATIPADIVQYYGYLLRATQKLLYLYGFPEIDMEEKGEKFDSETMNILIVCFGVMYGTAGANNALKAIGQALGTGVEKKLLFPHCGISFGAVNIIYHQNKILLEKRSDSGQWGFISGRMEVNESMIDAAIRETFEETAIKLEKESVEFLGISDNPSRIALYPDGNCFRIISAIFKSECNSLSTLEKSDESMELRLFDLEEIRKLDIVETHIDILNYL